MENLAYVVYGWPQRTLREVKILTRLKHENIIDLRDILCEDRLDKLKV